MKPGYVRFGLLVALITIGLLLALAPFTGDPADMAAVPDYLVAFAVCLVGLAILARKENP